jgi:hypothetical protein
MTAGLRQDRPRPFSKVNSKPRLGSRFSEPQTGGGDSSGGRASYLIEKTQAPTGAGLRDSVAMLIFGF